MLQAKISIFNSAKCDSNKSAITRNTIYDSSLARFAFAVAYETCEELADRVTEKDEKLAEKESTIHYLQAVNQKHQERNEHLKKIVLEKLNKLQQVARSAKQRPKKNQGLIWEKMSRKNTELRKQLKHSHKKSRR